MHLPRHLWLNPKGNSSLGVVQVHQWDCGVKATLVEGLHSFSSGKLPDNPLWTQKNNEFYLEELTSAVVTWRLAADTWQAASSLWPSLYEGTQHPSHRLPRCAQAEKLDTSEWGYTLLSANLLPSLLLLVSPCHRLLLGYIPWNVPTVPKSSFQ